MEISSNIIAKKYAIAFLNLYIQELTDIDFEKISKLHELLKDNKQFYVYLSIPGIPILIKQKALNRVAQNLNLCKPIKKLMFVLLEQNRIDILDKVLNQTEFCYRVYKNIQVFLVTSSNSLQEHEKNSIIKFIKQKTKSNVIVDFKVNEKLICGLRIHSNKFLWERSIDKQLKDVKKIIFKQVGLW